MTLKYRPYLIGGLVVTAAAWAALHRQIKRAIAADPERPFLENPPAGQAISVRASDGTMLHAEVFGPDGAPTIVLAHGWMEDIPLWIYQIRDLSPEFRVVAYNLRGHGRSERAANDDYSFDRFGEDVEAILNACVPDGERAIFAGHSMGAMSVVAWAEHHDAERRLSAVALLNTGIGDLLPEQLLFPVPQVLRPITVPIGRRTLMGNPGPIPRHSSPVQLAAIRHIAFTRHESPAKVAFYERMLVQCPGSVRAACGIAMADMDLVHALPRLTVPALVMCGERDKLTPPAHARRIADELPKLVRLLELPGTAHIGPLERPYDVSVALRELARSVTEPLRARVA